MLLAADVGNTQTVFGLWNKKSLVSTCRVSTSSYGTSDEWCWMLQTWLTNQDQQKLSSTINEAILSSVVPSVTGELLSAFKSVGALRVAAVTPNMSLPFTFDYPNYMTIGADRLANAIAGIKFYGDDLIIIDMGTAITFCLITAGVYRGGVIAPGFAASVRSLAERTAKLPAVSLKYKQSALSKSTATSIEAGMYFGWRGLVREILHSLMQSPEALLATTKIKTLVTGGITQELGFIGKLADITDRHLTLRGLLAAKEYLF